MPFDRNYSGEHDQYTVYYNHESHQPRLQKQRQNTKDLFALRGNQRPPLAISDVPDGTQSLAVVCYSPDTPFIGGFYHWIVWNLPPTTTEIGSDYLPHGAIEGTTTWGRPGWGGPHPAFGTHRYQFFVYALSTVLDLPAKTRPKKFSKAIAPHIIERTMLTGKFGALDIFDLR